MLSGSYGPQKRNLRLPEVHPNQKAVGELSCLEGKQGGFSAAVIEDAENFSKLRTAMNEKQCPTVLCLGAAKEDLEGITNNQRCNAQEIYPCLVLAW